MPNDRPFFLFKVECPICKTINEYEQIKVGAYTEGERDTDFCPTDVEWRSPKYQAHNPLVFFTATCSNCFYSRELNNNYREWKTDNAFRTYRLKTIKEKHLEQLSAENPVISSLGTAIDIQRYPNESAIIKLHLAVYDELLTDHHSNLDLGRFYLRIGWVFRDFGKRENPNIALLSGLLREIDGKCHRTEESISRARDEFDNLATSVKSHFEAEQIPAGIRSQMYTYRDRYNAELNELGQAISTSEEKLTQVRSLVDKYRSDVLGGNQCSDKVSFGQHTSFVDFLSQLRTSWDGIVTSEREALEKAVAYYRAAFASGREIAPGTQQIQASYLIAELSRRIGDYDEAKQYFTSTIKTGQEFIYQNRRDQSRTQLARKILELAIEQGRANLAAAKPA